MKSRSVPGMKSVVTSKPTAALSWRSTWRVCAVPLRLTLKGRERVLMPALGGVLVGRIWGPRLVEVRE